MDGTIYRISGPVVIARGLSAPKMYDVVKVGSMGLIGEIIKLEGGDAIIQVYEDTTGIRPGEPVKTTGAPLSVTLGPGLIGSIYDGIQRPLDKIKASSGDFIARGVEAEALESKKKWHFVPLQSIKKGSEVHGGSVLGEVHETDLITHRILVPIGVSGKIDSISEGDYTINDTVAIVSAGQSKIEVKLSQKWPVRIPRPLNSKLPPVIPLITGQRVIDTFFPIAKGGTAAVPGPFGSGKCVDKNTLLMMGNGRIVTIEDVYKEGKKKGRLLESNSEEEIYDIHGLQNPSTISLTNKGISVTEPSIVYKGMSRGMIRIRTRTGKTAEITPIHKLHVLFDGKIIEKEARFLVPGEYIITPRKIELGLKDQQLDMLELLLDKRLYSVDEETNHKIRLFLKRDASKGRTRYNDIDLLMKNKGIPLDLVYKIALDHHIHLKIKAAAPLNGERINLPQKMTPELAEFLAYVVADGHLNKQNHSLMFYNTDKGILDRFAYLTEKLFGIKPHIYSNLEARKPFMAQIANRALFELVVALGIPYMSKAVESKIPECVLKSSDKSLASFIGGYIACNGNVYKAGRRIEITSKSRRIIEEFSFAFLRLGIVSHIGRLRKDHTSKISVTTSAQLSKLESLVNIYGKKGKDLQGISKHRSYTDFDTIPMPQVLKKMLKQKGVTTKLMKKGIYVSDFINKGNIETSRMDKLINELRKVTKIPKELERFQALLKSLFFDRLSTIQTLDVTKEVYDIEVPGPHNFVGGNGPLLLHNTVIQHQLAKWSDADVIVYCGAGERGNEMTEVLTTFPELKDPKTGKPLMDRTVLIANTSNMPVAAREASIYTSITIAEYYRDMGYSVALMADSTSRWAEALREISGRLEEMPGEEGYPAYLGRKIAEFYERAGRVETLGGNVGSVTAIGAVSPPGGDTSEPVSQNTLRVTRVFWALDAALANARHFPSINWLNSYSLYTEDLREWYDKNINKEWNELRNEAMKILQIEAEINEIVQLVGYDALPESNKVTLDIAKSIREDYLQQSAFDEVDTYSSMKKQYLMLKAIIIMGRKEYDAVKRGVMMETLSDFEAKQRIAKMKFINEHEIDRYVEDIMKSLEDLDKMQAITK